MYSMYPQRIMVGLIAVACVAASVRSTAGADPCDATGSASDAKSSVIVEEGVTIDVKYDARKDAVFGERVSLRRFIVGDLAKLDDLRKIVAEQSPRLELEDVSVEVRSLDGKKKRHRRKDLNWASVAIASNGVHYLDEEIHVAGIPGLHRGDEVRVEITHQLDGLYGLPIVTMGGEDVSVCSSWIEVRHPRDQVVKGKIRAPDGLAQSIVHTVEEDGRLTVQRWSAHDLDPRRSESWSLWSSVNVASLHLQFTACDREHLPNAFVCGESWEELARGYAQRVEAALAVTGELQDLASELVRGKTTFAERVDALYGHVQSSCRYLGLYRGWDGMLPASAAKTHDLGYGDCKGLAVLLLALLRAADIEAQPVLVRAGQEGPVLEDFPSLAQFNHFIVRALEGDEELWLDATADACPAGLVPMMDAVSSVLVVDAVTPQLRKIPSSAATPGRIDRNISGSLSESGHLSLSIEEHSTRNAALSRRAWLSSMTASEREEVIRELLCPEAVPFEVLESWVDLESAWDTPLTMGVRVRTESALPHDRDGYFLPREIASRLERFTHRGTRISPIDLRDLPSHRERFEIELLDGLVAADRDSAQVLGPGLRWTSRVSQDGGTLRIERSTDWEGLVLPSDRATELEQALDDIRARDTGYIQLVWTSGAEESSAGNP